jgi:signal transduction histidine kinase
MNIYRIIQEALNNALKYAEASTIEVLISEENSKLIITIKDNGKGFDEDITDPGNGLQNIRKRAREIDADVEIQSSRTDGTNVIVRIPL